MAPHLPVRSPGNDGSTVPPRANTRSSETPSDFSKPSGFSETQFRVASSHGDEYARDSRVDVRSNRVPTGPRRESSSARGERSLDPSKVKSNKRYRPDSDEEVEPQEKPKSLKGDTAGAQYAAKVAASIKELNEKYNALNKALQVNETTQDGHARTLIKHRKELESLTKEIGTQGSAIEALQTPIRSISSLEEGQSLNTVNIDAHEKQLEGVSVKFKEQDATISALKEDHINRIDKQLRTLAEIETKLKEQPEALVPLKAQKPFKELYHKVEHHGKMFEWYKNDYRALNDKRMEETKTSIESLQQDHECLKQTCQDLGSRLGMAETVVSSLVEFSVKEKARIDKLEKEKAQSDTVIEKLLERIEKLEQQQVQPDYVRQNQYKQLEERFDSIHKDNKEVKVQNDSMKKKIKDLEWRLKEEEKRGKDNLEAVIANAGTWQRELKKTRESYKDQLEKTATECKESMQVEIGDVRNELKQDHSSTIEDLRKIAETVLEEKMDTFSADLRGEQQSSFTLYREEQAATIRTIRDEFTQKYEEVSVKIDTRSRAEEMNEKYVTKEELDDTATKLKSDIEENMRESTHASEEAPQKSPENFPSKTPKDVRLVVEDQQISLDEHDASIKHLQKRLDKLPDHKKLMLDLRTFITSEVKKTQENKPSQLGPPFVAQMPPPGAIARQVNTGTYPHRGLQSFTNPNNSALTAIPGHGIQSAFHQRPALAETPPSSPHTWQDASCQVRTDPMPQGTTFCNVHPWVQEVNRFDLSYGYTGCWECNNGNNGSNPATR